MARPDDDHVCQPILGEAGELLAVAHVSPDISPEARAALGDLIAAVHRMWDAKPPEVRTEIERRQAASRERIAAMNRRLRKENQ